MSATTTLPGISLSRAAFVRLLDAVLNPNPDDPGRPRHPWGPFDPIGPVSGAFRDFWSVALNLQPLSPIVGPLPDPWGWSRMTPNPQPLSPGGVLGRNPGGPPSRPGQSSTRQCPCTGWAKRWGEIRRNVPLRRHADTSAIGPIGFVGTFPAGSPGRGPGRWSRISRSIRWHCSSRVPSSKRPRTPGRTILCKRTSPLPRINSSRPA